MDATQPRARGESRSAASARASAIGAGRAGWRQDRDFGGQERELGGEERYWQERERAEDDDLWSSEDYGSYDTDEFERFESPRRRSLGGYDDQHGGYRTGPRSDFPRYFGNPGEYPGQGAERRNWPESRGQRELGRFRGGQRELGRFSGRGPKGYQRGDDRVREDVCDRLTDDAHIDASNLTVNVKDGEVTLVGTVDDRQSKRRAEDLAEIVPGVKQVHNQLRVQSRSQEDDELTRRSAENGKASTRH